eukprot:13700269-Alexandrium_andersonii.AAC.1
MPRDASQAPSDRACPVELGTVLADSSESSDARVHKHHLTLTRTAWLRDTTHVTVPDSTSECIGNAR